MSNKHDEKIRTKRMHLTCLSFIKIILFYIPGNQLTEATLRLQQYPNSLPVRCTNNLAADGMDAAIFLKMLTCTIFTT